MVSSERILISGIPCVLYGMPSDKICLYVHGKDGYMEEAERLASIVCENGFQVLSCELPEHGCRKGSDERFFPWNVAPELTRIYLYLNERYDNIVLYAVSIGAYFSLLAFKEMSFDKVLFVSPILDMKRLIFRMMEWANVSVEMLKEKKTIETGFGETLSIEYLDHATKHPILSVSGPTYIMWAGNDQLTERSTVLDFAVRFGARLDIMEDGEHFFHTEKQLAVLDNWIRNVLL